MKTVAPFTVTADLDLSRRISPYLVDRDADVTIAAGDVPERLSGSGADGPAYDIRPGRFLLRVPNGLRLLIEDGRRISYQRAAGQPDNEVALFLLGAAWAALSYQRGLIPLHASAVIRQGNVHAFSGPSGAGKSTMAAALGAVGLPFFTDDILLLDPARLDPDPLCFSGQKDLKLWSDSIDMTRAVSRGRVRSVAGFDKYFADPPVESGVAAGSLSAIYVLVADSNATSPSVESLAGAGAVMEVLGCIYRPAFANAILGRQALFRSAAAIAGRVSVLRFRRRMAAEDFNRNRETMRAQIVHDG